MSSVLWHCWLSSRKGIWPLKNWVIWCWCGYLSGARCRFAYGPADTTATHYLLLQKSRLVLPFWYQFTQVFPYKGLLNGCCYCNTIIWTLSIDGWTVACSAMEWGLHKGVEHPACTSLWYPLLLTRNLSSHTTWSPMPAAVAHGHSSTLH